MDERWEGYETRITSFHSRGCCRHENKIPPFLFCRSLRFPPHNSIHHPP
jgi:hypothetical protein